MVFLCLKLKAVAAYLHVEKIKQMEGRQAQYTRSLKPPCHCLNALYSCSVCFGLLLMSFRKKNDASKFQIWNWKLVKYFKTSENSLF